VATLIGQGFIEVVPRLAGGFGPQLEAQLVGGTKAAGAAATKEAEAAGAAGGRGFLGGMRNSLAGLGGMIKTAVGIGAVIGIAEFAKKSVDAFKDVAGSTLALQRVMGGTTEAAGKWNAVAERYGISAGQMSVAMKTLSKDVMAGKGPLQDLGVNTKDVQGHLIPLGDVLMQVADKFHAMPNGAEKSRLAVQLFGKQGLALLPILNKGSDSINELMDTAKKMGLVLDDSATGKMKDAAEAQRNLNQATKGLEVQFGEKLLPTITSFVNFLGGTVVPTLGKVFTFFQQNSTAVKIFAEALIGLWATTKIVSAAQATYNALLVIYRAVAATASAASTGLGAAITFATGPIGIIVIAIAALVAACVLLWMHWDQVWNWIGHHKAYAAIIAILGGPIILPIFALVAAAKFLWNNWDKIWKDIQGAFLVAWHAVDAGLQALQRAWNTAWGAFAAVIGPVWNGIRAVVVGAISVISSVISTGMNAVRAVWNGIWSRVSADVAIVWNAIRPIIQTGISIISSAISTGMSVVRTVWNAAWTAISAIVSAVWTVIRPIIQVGMTIISAAVSAGMTVVRAVWNAAWTAISAVVSAVWAVIGPIVRVGIAAISAVVSTGMTVIRTAWNAAWTVISTILSAIWTVIKAVVKAGMDWIFSPISTGMNAIKTVFSTVWNAISAAFSAVWTVLRTVTTTAINAISAVISTVWNAVRAVFTTVWNAISAAFTAVWNALRTTATTVINAISATITAVWNAVRSFFATVWNAISAAFTAVWNAMRASATAIINAISATITAVWNAVRAFFTTIWNAISAFFTNIWNVMRTTATTVINAISATITTVWNAVRNTFTTIWNAISAFFTMIWNALRNTATTVINAISATITVVWNTVRNTFSSVWNAISSFFSGIWNTLKTTASTAIDWISSKLSSVMNAISSAWHAAWQGMSNVLSSIWQGIVGFFKTPINIIIQGLNDFFTPINKVISWAIGGSGPLPHIDKLAKGGRLPGYGGGDSIPAMLEPGEAVVPKHLVPEMAPWAKKKGIPGFAEGGMVGVPLNAANGPVNQGAWWDDIPGAGIVKDVAGSIVSGVKDLAGMIGDAAKWVYTAGAGLFRIGAGAAAQAIFDPMKAAVHGLTGPLGEPGKMAGGMFDKTGQSVIDWIKGKEGPDPNAMGGSGGGVADSNAVVAFAKTLIGCPYRPPYYDPSGFSCDGLVWYVFKHFGIDLPRGATNQMNAVQRLGGAADAQPGDVVGFHQDGPSSGNPLGLEFHHIGLVSGPDQTINALGTNYGVVVSSIQGISGGPGAYIRYGRVLQNLNPGWGTPAYIAAHSGAAPSGGGYSQAQIQAALAAAGAPAGVAHTLSAIAMHENPASTRVTNQTGTYDSVFALGESWTIPLGLDINRLNTDLNYAAQQAYALYLRSGGYGPWEAYTNGSYLASMAKGGLVQSYDRGGFLPPGLSMAYNGTGKPEAVGNASTVQNNSVTLTLNVANGDPVTMRAAAQQVVDDALTALARRLSSGAGRN
jgi:phage-related protein